MPEIFDLHEARTDLSKLVDLASASEEIVIAKAGRPVARLVPFEPQRMPRKPGGWEGKVWIADDFDAPLPGDLWAAAKAPGTDEDSDLGPGRFPSPP